MLNCTDIECILHHHHYYHHGGQFHHYLQDDRAHHEHLPHESVMSGDYPNSDIISGITNGTDPDDPNNGAATHIDDPNGSLYMLCGVLIAMLLVGLIIILLAVTISKLRKREENLHTTAPTVTTNHNNNNVIQQQQQAQHNNLPVTGTGEVVISCPDSTESLPPPFLWTNSRCSTTASSQYTLYNNDEDNLVHLPCEEPRECKGLRKNLSGKWRRLVKKKPQQDVYSIPTEIREQLKTIYVY